jgi:dolichol-phosphate mannosyltransferase
MILSIIIPVKGEEPYLPQLLDEIDKVLSRDWKYEVLVQKEEGLTNAVVEGVKRAEGGIVIVMDSDGSHNPKDLPEMLGKFGDYDIVIGIKYKDERSLWRRIITKGFTFITGIVLELRIHDLSGFILARKDLFNVVKPSDDFKFILPLIYLNKGVRVYEVPTVHSERKGGKSKANYKQAWKILKLIFKLKSGLYRIE